MQMFRALKSVIRCAFVSGSITLVSIASAATDAYWLNSRGGSWSNPSNWSTAPLVPNNGVPTPESTYRAVFDQSSTPYTVSIRNLDLTLDGLFIQDEATVHQSAGATTVDRLDIQNGRFLLTNLAALKAQEVHTSGDGVVEVGQGLISDSILSGTIRATGGPGTESVLRNVRLQDAIVEVPGMLQLRGTLDGVGTIELLEYLDILDPMTIGPSITVHVPRDSDAAFRSEMTDFYGRLDVEGSLMLHHSVVNYGQVQIRDGGVVSALWVREENDTLPGSWSIASGGHLSVLSRFTPGPAVDITFQLSGPTNWPLIQSPRITANGKVHVEVAPSYMPRPELPISLWRAEQSLTGEFSEIILDDLPRGFSWDTSQLASSGTLHVDGPAPVRVAFTKFGEPPLDATSYDATALSSELGFQTVLQLNDGNFAGAGVNDFTGLRALSFQSVDSETTFDPVPIADFATTEVDVYFSISDTGYERDYIEISVTGDRADEAPIVFSDLLLGYAPIETHRLTVSVPTTWTDVTIQVRTSTNSSSGAERLNLHRVDVVGHSMETRNELTGDFAVDRELNPDDLRKLDAVIARQINQTPFDLDGSGEVDQQDRLYWIEEVWKSYVGDANSDGLFDSADFVSVFQHGQYEDTIAGNSTWDRGDWNGDRDFDTSDLVVAFQRGGYEQGPRAAAHAVPEPHGGLSLLAAIATAVLVARNSVSSR
jgi:hypothetical protein